MLRMYHSVSLMLVHVHKCDRCRPSITWAGAPAIPDDVKEQSRRLTEEKDTAVSIASISCGTVVVCTSDNFKAPHIHFL